MPADMQMNDGSSSVHVHCGFPTKLMEQTIVMSLDDIMGFSHATEGGKYKRRV